MAAWRSIAFLAISLLAGALASPAAAGAACPTVGGKEKGFLSLRELGHPAPIRLSQERRTARVRFCFPPGARQPQGGRWYTMRMNVRATFARSARGEYLFSANTNGHAAAQIEFKLHRRTIVSDSLGLYSGHVVIRSSYPQAHARLANALGERGVSGGAATLGFKVERTRGGGLRQIVVRPDSGVGSTTASPYELKIVPIQQTINVGAGEDVEVPFSVRRRGTRPDVGVRVRLVGAQRGLSPLGATTQRFGRIGGGQQDGAFHVHADAPGQYPLTIEVPGRYNEPSALAVVNVAERHRRLRPLVVLLLVGSAIVAVAAFLRLGRRS